MLDAPAFEAFFVTHFIAHTVIGHDALDAFDAMRLEPFHGVSREDERDVAGLIGHLESALDEAGYFHVPDRTPATRRTLAQMLVRPDFTSEEVRTLRGVIRALAEGPRRR